MSLEWARARLLQHREALRKLCEAQAAGRARQPALERRQHRHAEVIDLQPDRQQRPLTQAAEKGMVLTFGQPRRRRRA
jgi:chromatin segregation and condensation protein Rec8/ScpA/Scc1 (kleisin family)